jgi:hypothetical protein
MFVVTAGGGSAAACLAALDGALLSVGAVVSWAAIGSLAVIFGLLSFASKVVVDPATLTVYTEFSRRAIPRHLVSAVNGTRHGANLIHVQGHPDVLVPVGVHPLWVRGTWNYRAAELKPAGRIRSACAAVPWTSPPPDTTVHRGRPLIVVAAVLSGTVLLTTFVLGLSGALGR